MALLINDSPLQRGLAFISRYVLRVISYSNQGGEMVWGRLFDAKEAFTVEPSAMDYSGEDLEARIGRRAEKWMPATLQQTA